MQLGCAISSEEHAPLDLVTSTARAEEARLAFVDAGHDHVYLHQIGPDQDGFLRFAERELLPPYAKAEAVV